MTDVVSSETLPIRVDTDVQLVRHRARDLAARCGMDAFASAAVTTAASELSRNALVHGGGGHAVVELVRDGDRHGVRLTFVDQGPGIAEIDRALAGGYSTGRSLGLGLSGSRRLVDEFEVRTAPAAGTTVEVVKWSRFRR